MKTRSILNRSVETKALQHPPPVPHPELFFFKTKNVSFARSSSIHQRAFVSTLLCKFSGLFYDL
ncbi:hypothetical protein OPIT5_03180 [Opitutaceae bacterium TAV5]|nr:hypothetical protein OPIT5_03180 [Opitutaceae bacterium TAV5]